MLRNLTHDDWVVMGTWQLRKASFCFLISLGSRKFLHSLLQDIFPPEENDSDWSIVFFPTAVCLRIQVNKENKEFKVKFLSLTLFLLCSDCCSEGGGYKTWMQQPAERIYILWASVVGTIVLLQTYRKMAFLNIFCPSLVPPPFPFSPLQFPTNAKIEQKKLNSICSILDNIYSY